MAYSGLAIRIFVVVFAVGLLGVIRYRPWSAPCKTSIMPGGTDGASTERKSLVVGYLPVT